MEDVLHPLYSDTHASVLMIVAYGSTAERVGYLAHFTKSIVAAARAAARTFVRGHEIRTFGTYPLALRCSPWRFDVALRCAPQLLRVACRPLLGP